MVYLFVFISILVGVFYFDFNNKNKKSKWSYYYILVGLLILIAGFAYRMGDDGIVYELEYAYYKGIFDIDYNYLSSFPGRLPGWLLLTSICKSLSDSFFVFKLAHALIVNLLVALFIKRATKYVFTGLLFYSILFYFDFNFGALRQSVSVALFLFSLNYYEKRKWVVYYSISIIAFLFHDSSAILFLLPFLRGMQISSKTTLFFAVIGGCLIIFAREILAMVLTFSSAQDMFYRMEFYADRIDSTNITFNVLNLLLNAVVPVFIILKINNKKEIVKYSEFIYVYIFFYILSMFTPIVYRLNLFFGLFYMLFWLEAFVYYAKSVCKTKVSVAFLSVILCVTFCGYRKRLWFEKINNIPVYSYIYPYSSVFTQDKDPNRETLFSYGNLSQ